MPKLIPTSEKKHALSYSMVLISFTVSLLWWVSWIVGTGLGFTVPEWSAAECSIFLAPMIALLFGDKWREGKEKLKDATGEVQTE